MQEIYRGIKAVDRTSRQSFIGYLFCSAVFGVIIVFGTSDLLLQGNTLGERLRNLFVGFFSEELFFPLIGAGFFAYLAGKTLWEMLWKYQSGKTE